MALCLISLFLFAAVVVSTGFANILYMSNNGSNDTSCLNGPQACANLTLVLDHIRHQNDIEVYIELGQYDLSPTVRLIFEQVQNVYIARNGNEGIVDISCQGTTSGLSFSNCTNVTIAGLSFIGCGMEHNSTSLNFTTRKGFLSFFASLYFEGCSFITLDSISVSDSLGIAVQFYYTPNVNIINSDFINNTLGMYNISGGVYIEFPYCFPGEKCNDTNIPTEYVTNSQYIISGCNFINNTALHDPGRYVFPIGYDHVAFGQGGGLSVFFKGSASDCTVIVEDCTFTNNTAEYGGGAYFDMQDSSYGIHITMNGSNNFTNNIANYSGGGVYLSFLFVADISKVKSCSYSISDTTFAENLANNYGGGLYYITIPQDFQTRFNSLELSSCTWTKNEAFSGAGLFLIAFRDFRLGATETVNITNSSFEGNSLTGLHKRVAFKKLGHGALFTDEVSITFFNFASFKGNAGTALVAMHAVISVAEDTSVEFCNNSGIIGGAIAFFSTVMVVYKNTLLHFLHNNASELGGALFVKNIGQQGLPNSCFLRYYNFKTHAKDWNTSFIFSGNVAGGYSNSIYSFSLSSCIFGRGFAENDIDDVFCWNNGIALWQYNGSTENCTEHILTAAKSLTGSNKLEVFPGKKMHMNISAYDEQGLNVTFNLVLHAISTSPAFSVDEDFSYTSKNEIKLYQKLDETANASLTLETIGEDSFLQNELYIKFLDCPPGLVLNNQFGECQCNGTFAQTVQCDNSKFSSTLLPGYWLGKYNETPVVGHCINCNNKATSAATLDLGDSYDNLSSLLCGPHKKGVLCSNCTEGYAPAINFDEFHCVKCDAKSDVAKGAIVFLFLDIILPLLLLVAIFFSDVPLTSGLLHGPILFGQMITTVVPLDADNIIAYEAIFNGSEVTESVYMTTYGIFNNEIFMSFQNYCLSQSLTYAGIIALQYLTAILPLGFVVFVAIIYYCEEHKWRTCLNIRKPKCMRKSRWASRFKNSPNALATFILLSYTKIAIITGYLLTPISLWAANDSTYRQVLYRDGTIEYSLNLHKDYLKFFLAAFFVGLPLITAVPLFLILFRSNDPESNGGFFNHLIHQFQKEFREFPSNASIAFESSQKKRTISHLGRLNYECTFCAATECCKCKLLRTRYCLIPLYMKWSRYDFRWLAGGLFILRLMLIIPYIVWNTITQYFVQFTVCMIVGVAIITIRPYKRDKERSDLYKYVDPNAVEAGSLLLLALLIALSMYQYSYTVADIPLSKWAYVLQSLLVWVPFVWFVIAYCGILCVRYQYKKNEYLII